MAFLFLSAMLIGAFMTLPIECVHLDELMIQQLPERGVKTKNSKAAQTYLLNIEDLLEVVRAWDAKVRGELPETFLWYARLTKEGAFALEESTATRREVSQGSRFRAELVEMCERAGIPYRSPHKLRHGFAVQGRHAAPSVLHPQCRLRRNGALATSGEFSIVWTGGEV